MRIISGKYRGLKLAEFAGGEIRPTADRVKESLFNIISAYVADAVVLDLFCGSGNLGIEALSRGAGTVCFNDLSADSIAVLKRIWQGLKRAGITAFIIWTFPLVLRALEVLQMRTEAARALPTVLLLIAAGGRSI